MMIATVVIALLWEITWNMGSLRHDSEDSFRELWLGYESHQLIHQAFPILNR